MIDINLPNVITISLISVAAIALATYAFKATGLSIPGFNDGV